MGRKGTKRPKISKSPVKSSSIAQPSTSNNEIGFQQELSNELLCPICMTTFFDPRVTECGHIFCLQCIESWYTSNKDTNNRCPTCNKPTVRPLIQTLIKCPVIENVISLYRKYVSVDEEDDVQLMAISDVANLKGQKPSKRARN